MPSGIHAVYESSHSDTKGLPFIDRVNGLLTCSPSRQLQVGQRSIPVLERELWTSKQRQASSIHEISYRACFKPQLPRFFIGQLSQPGDWVYDPFSGRGTTAVEAAMLQRRVIANDANPLSTLLCKPRLQLPDMQAIVERLAQISWESGRKADIDLSMFYHPQTELQLVSLRDYLEKRRKRGKSDAIDGWIRMVATSRLTGHSPGFFSVYTLPPNQAVSPQRQLQINRSRGQTPPVRDVPQLILRKTRQLQKRLTEEQRSVMQNAAAEALFLEKDAAKTRQIADNSVQLTVTSPPFLNVVQYSADNWLRCWFNHIDAEDISKRLTITATLPQWRKTMGRVFRELHRITRPGGYVAFEVGEVRKGQVRLDEEAIPLGLQAGFNCLLVLINSQHFTKTANIWGISNNKSGTNSNRIIVFRK